MAIHEGNKMIKRSGIKKSMLLLLGCIVLLTGCAKDNEINIEEEKQDIVQSGLSEVSHFKDKYYVSGCMSQYEGLSECSYAEFTGNIEDSGCVLKYDDDGYGHEGVLTITFYENGIGVYVDEGGEPNGHGFPTGYNYYMKQESK